MGPGSLEAVVFRQGTVSTVWRDTTGFGPTLGPLPLPLLVPAAREASHKRKGGHQVRASSETVSKSIGVRKTRSSVLFVLDTTLHTTHNHPTRKHAWWSSANSPDSPVRVLLPRCP